MAANTYRCLQMTSQGQQEGISGYSARAASPDGVERPWDRQGSPTALPVRPWDNSHWGGNWALRPLSTNPSQIRDRNHVCLSTAINSLPCSQIFHWVAMLHGYQTIFPSTIYSVLGLQVCALPPSSPHAFWFCLCFGAGIKPKAFHILSKCSPTHYAQLP